MSEAKKYELGERGGGGIRASAVPRAARGLRGDIIHGHRMFVSLSVILIKYWSGICSIHLSDCKRWASITNKYIAYL